MQIHSVHCRNMLLYWSDGALEWHSFLFHKLQHPQTINGQKLFMSSVTLIFAIYKHQAQVVEKKNICSDQFRFVVQRFIV